VGDDGAEFFPGRVVDPFQAFPDLYAGNVAHHPIDLHCENFKKRFN